MKLKTTLPFMQIMTALGLAVGIWIMSNQSFIQAAEEDGDFKCAEQMVEEGSALVLSYENFLTEYFQAAEPSSQQVEAALSYYDQILRALNSLYERGLDLDGTKTFDETSEEVAACENVRSQYVSYLNALLEVHVLQSANSKRTFNVVDGLKILNSDMDVFSFDFHATFPALIEKFNSALPCYARKCI